MNMIAAWCLQSGTSFSRPNEYDIMDKYVIVSWWHGYLCTCNASLGLKFSVEYGVFCEPYIVGFPDRVWYRCRSKPLDNAKRYLGIISMVHTIRKWYYIFLVTSQRVMELSQILCRLRVIDEWHMAITWNKCCLIINKVFWHSPKDKYQSYHLLNVSKKCKCQIIANIVWA